MFLKLLTTQLYFLAPTCYVAVHPYIDVGARLCAQHTVWHICDETEPYTYGSRLILELSVCLVGYLYSLTSTIVCGGCKADTETHNH